MENSPLSYTRWGTISTDGYCLDLDVADTILVTAENYNGYSIYGLSFDEDGILDTVTTIYHNSNPNPESGDGRSEKVVISETHNILFVLDRSDYILVQKIDDLEFYGSHPNNLITDDCYGSNWWDVTIDDSQNDIIRIYPLLKHYGAEEGINPDDDPSEYDDYSTSIAYIEFDPYDNAIDTKCEYSKNLKIITDQLFYSDSLIISSNGELGVKVYKQTNVDYCADANGQILDEFYNLDICEGDTNQFGQSMFGDDDIENFGNFDDCIYGNGIWDVNEKFTDCGVNNGVYICDNDDGWDDNFGNGVYDEGDEFIDCIDFPVMVCEGDTIWEEDGWVDEEEGVGTWDNNDSLTIDLDGDGDYDPGEDFIDCRVYGIDKIKDSYYCEMDTANEDAQYFFGLGGKYEPEGGLLPLPFAEYDTPGEVNTVFSIGSVVFAGLSNSYGCRMTLIGDGGDVIYTLPFAQGYTINGVHASNGLIVLAAGYSGVIVYEWDGIMNVTYSGRLETSYAYNVKVFNDAIYAATREGIDIFKIER